MTGAEPTHLTRRFAGAIAHLPPGSFALVMATGIISIACHLLGIPALPQALLVINLFAYVVLGLLLLARLAVYARNAWNDLRDHERGPGFFTVVAGTCILGSQLLVVAEQPAIARVLWYLAIGLWFMVMYGFFAAVVLRENKPSLETGINGAWLIAIVATQGVSVLGSLLAPSMPERAPVLFIALCMYLLGAMLYLTIITLIFYRFTFLPLSLDRLTPAYWINMGAVAITTLAGSTLLLARGAWPLLDTLRPFLAGFTLFFWVTATWWIPLLVILGIWRHVIRRFALRYDAGYWAMVFPLGMYTACTLRLSRALDLPMLLIVPQYFVYLALISWGVLFGAMLHHLARWLSAERE